MTGYFPQEEEGSFLRRHRSAVVAGTVVAVLIAIGAYLIGTGEKSPARRVQELTMVKIETPPPPPPPQQLPTPKMIEQPKMVTPEVKQEHVDEAKPAAPAKGPLGLDAKADGPGDSFNLAGNAGGNGLLDGGGGGSRWGWYASMVQEQIAAALRDNPRTRHARFNVQISIWANPAGHVERVRLDSSTGDAGLDKVLQEEVFPRLALKQAPPPDMPMPIVMRNVAQRPG
jgi:outer membrane biosynthesis protein TonB